MKLSGTQRQRQRSCLISLMDIQIILHGPKTSVVEYND